VFGLVLVLVLAAVVASGWHPGSARADGDPASDVLYAQSVFLPQDAGTSSGQRAQLSALLQAAGRRGYNIKVALIASPTDLGSVSELWRQPRNYALFLGQELSLVYRGVLLVIMPGGYGLYTHGGPAAAQQSALAALPAPGGGGLGAAALSAIPRLAAAAGYKLAVPSSVTPSAASSGSGDALAWIVFAIGGALIALAWVASLRARPVRIGHRRVSPR
jgi:hypothetical protein